MVRRKFSLKKFMGGANGRVNFVSESKVSMSRHWYFFLNTLHIFLSTILDRVYILIKKMGLEV